MNLEIHFHVFGDILGADFYRIRSSRRGMDGQFFCLFLFLWMDSFILILALILGCRVS